MSNQELFCLSEEIRGKEYVVATYYMNLHKSIDVIAKASSLAIGQTIGTWIPIPGITDEIRSKYMGKVINVFDVPAVELSTQTEGEKREYLIQIAYPTMNFDNEFPLLFTTLLGNDASTSAQAKLVDLEMPKQFVDSFRGPNFGIKGIRNLTGVKDRPLLLNMIKPCTGLSPVEGAKIFYETALGGVDFIKDDELLGSPSYSLAVDRVKEYRKAGEAAYEKTGKKVTYIVNVTDSSERIMDTVKNVVELGAEAIMLNFAVVGYSTLHQIAKTVNVPILAHCASAGAICEGTNSGMSSPLAVGKFPRLAGADMVMINTPYGGYPMQHQKYLQTINQLSLPLYDLKQTMPSIGGGVHPGIVEKYIKEAGNDVILAAGGAIQGHPSGTVAGVKAMSQAIDAVIMDVPLDEAAKEHEELAEALDLWGYKK